MLGTFGSYRVDGGFTVSVYDSIPVGKIFFLEPEPAPFKPIKDKLIKPRAPSEPST